MRLFCVYVVLCLGSGLAMGLSLARGEERERESTTVCVRNDYGTRPGSFNGCKSHWGEKRGALGTFSRLRFVRHLIYLELIAVCNGDRSVMSILRVD
jgi:hypothetical protein